MTSGLLTTDSSAVELVPLLQAEVKKLREMLVQQRILPLDRGLGEWEERESRESREFNESKVVEEMRERVRELETQLAEREKLIDTLDMQRREQLLEDEEEAERMFLMSEDRNSRGGDKRGIVSKGNGRYSRNEKEVDEDRDNDNFDYDDDPYNVSSRKSHSNNNDNNNNINNNNINNNDKNNNNNNNNNNSNKNNNNNDDDKDKLNPRDRISWEKENRDIIENKRKKEGKKNHGQNGTDRKSVV